MQNRHRLRTPPTPITLHRRRETTQATQLRLGVISSSMLHGLGVILTDELVSHAPPVLAQASAERQTAVRGGIDALPMVLVLARITDHHHLFLATANYRLLVPAADTSDAPGAPHTDTRTQQPDPARLGHPPPSPES
jgi:hypothetical protein